MAEITARSISKSFGDFKALDKITFSVEKGEFYGLFGPNGAGKTTLLRILTGQLAPDSGKGRTAGVPLTKGVDIKKRIGIVPEAETPPTFLTAEEFLQLVCRIRKVDDIDGRVERWIDFFELDDKRNVLCRDLSKGQRQKMMLATAFVHEPRLLLLDEPFINLDPIFQRKIRRYLQGLIDKGRTIFMCTHILEIAEKLCTKVAVINKGKIVAEGTLEDISIKEGERLEDIFMRLVEEG